MDPVGRLLAAGACGMDTGGRLVAGSRNRNEFVVINADDGGRLSVRKISLFIFFSPLFLDFRPFFALLIFLGI